MGFSGAFCLTGCVSGSAVSAGVVVPTTSPPKERGTNPGVVPWKGAF